MNRIQSELSTIANIPSLEFVAASQSALNTIPKIDFGDLSRYSNKKYVNNEIQELDANFFKELIKYFDHKEAISKTGWIYKGNVEKYSRQN